jgi:hypothetical protein
MGLGINIVVGSSAADDLSDGDQVEVYECIGEPTTYRLRYGLSITDDDYPLLTDSRLDPGAQLGVVVPDGDDTQVLVQGQVYGQRVHIAADASDSWAEIVGGDGSVEMDRDVKQTAFSAQAISDSISSILSSYGLTPDVDDLSVTTSEDDHVLVQNDTDLRFLRRLARRYGYWFWLSTDTDGTTTAHFKRPSLDGDPVLTLVMNADTPTLEALDLEWDVERPNQAIATQLGLRDKSPIDGQVARSPLTALGTTALADLADPRTVQVIAPVDDVGDLQARAEGALIEAGWFVRARGRTSLRALGNHVLRAHTVVGVSGIGTRHSGKYVVRSVRHVIDHAAYAMEFELIRNAWGNS